MKKIVYWSPVISKIATFNAVINSAKTLKTYSNDYEVSIINTTGEYDELKNNNFNIKIVDFFKIKKNIVEVVFLKPGFLYLKYFLKIFLN